MREKLDPQAGLAFMEAAYAWELDDSAWLRGLVERTAGIWRDPQWACAFEYDVSTPGHFCMSAAQFWSALKVPAETMVARMVERGPSVAPLYRTVNVGFPERPAASMRSTPRCSTRSGLPTCSV